MIPINWREKLNISLWAINFPRLTLFFWVVVAVAGIFAFSSLKYALLPELNFPVVLIQVQAPLTSSELETQVIKPLEQPLLQQKIGTEVNSTSYPGQGIISVVLAGGSSLAVATQQVEQAISPVSLPGQTELKVIPYNLNQSAVARYAVSSDHLDLLELAHLSQTQILPLLTTLPGVAEVNLLGDGLLPGGGSASLVRFNGQEVLGLEIIKTPEGNTLEVAKRVKQKIEEIDTSLTNVKLSLAESQVRYIQEATQATIDALVAAIILAILVIYLFLRNGKATLIAALAIPISLLGTFIVMAVAGFNLETLTLLALALVMGVVVDDAIVEVENTIRYLELGESPKTAVIKATQEIGLTVTASTLTIVAVFLPIGLMGGTLGNFFSPFGLTIAAAVLTSLLVARTLAPVLAVYWLRAKNSPNQATVRVQHRITQKYRSLLRWSLHHRLQVIALALISFILGIGLIPLIPQGFIPDLDRGEFNLIYTTVLPNLKLNPKTEVKREDESQFEWLQSLSQSPERFLLRRTKKVGEELETALLGIPEIESSFSVLGVRGEPNRGKIYLQLRSDRTLTTAAVREKVRQSLPTIPGVTVSIEAIPFVETSDNTPLKLALLGEDLTSLETLAEAIAQQPELFPELEDLKITGSNQDQGIIERFNGQRVIYLTANLREGEALGNATTRVTEVISTLIPPGVTSQWRGDAAKQAEVFGQFTLTLVGALVCMMVSLILPFGRLLEPAVVGLCLPLSIVGATFSLLITQSDFGMISLMGLIFLLGLQDKNAILLMDYANQLRSQGWSRQQALIETGVVRFRPIIMTTASTILGMLPIALGWGAGAELRQPMAVAIIGGLVTSTLLSLIVVPVVYTLLEDWQQGKKFFN